MKNNVLDLLLCQRYQEKCTKTIEVKGLSIGTNVIKFTTSKATKITISDIVKL